MNLLRFTCVAVSLKREPTLLKSTAFGKLFQLLTTRSAKTEHLISVLELFLYNSYLWPLALRREDNPKELYRTYNSIYVFSGRMIKMIVIVFSRFHTCCIPTFTHFCSLIVFISSCVIIVCFYSSFLSLIFLLHRVLYAFNVAYTFVMCE